MSYTIQVLIHGTQEQVFRAIAGHVHEWWGNTTAPTVALHDEFTTQFGKTFWKFRITWFEPNRKIVWKCVDAKHVHNGYGAIEREWVGTLVEWVLEGKPGEDGTLLHFIHHGLTLELNCYEICWPAWEMFVTGSLKQFVETGKGLPIYSG